MIFCLRHIFPSSVHKQDARRKDRASRFECQAALKIDGPLRSPLLRYRVTQSQLVPLYCSALFVPVQTGGAVSVPVTAPAALMIL